MAISVENRHIFPPRVFIAPLKGSPWNWVSAQGAKKNYQKVEKLLRTFKIGLAVLTQYRCVTTSQPSSHLSVASTALASVVRVKARSGWTDWISTPIPNINCSASFLPVIRLYAHRIFTVTAVLIALHSHMLIHCNITPYTRT